MSCQKCKVNETCNVIVQGGKKYSLCDICLELYNTYHSTYLLEDFLREKNRVDIDKENSRLARLLKDSPWN